MAFLGTQYRDFPIAVFYYLISLRVHVKSMLSDLQTRQKQSTSHVFIHRSSISALNGIQMALEHSMNIRAFFTRDAEVSFSCLLSKRKKLIL